MKIGNSLNSDYHGESLLESQNGEKQGDEKN
jgi:hypothetical protein